MKKLISNYLIFFAIASALAVLLIKFLILPHLYFGGNSINEIFDFSDVTVVITGAFFVISFILAGTLTDYKESERIPSDIASNLESIEDWILLGLKAPRLTGPSINSEPLDKGFVKKELLDTSNQIVNWVNSKEKDSFSIFPHLRKLNEIAYYFSIRGADKESIKGIQENTNQLRKNLTRIYTISRTEFITPAYTLAKSILLIILIMLLLAKFRSRVGDGVVTFSLSFVFIYLYFLIKSLDDPFNQSSKTKVDIKPILRFINRIDDSF
jgi:hypothetical protein